MSVHQKYVTVSRAHVPNIRAPMHLKHMFTEPKEEIAATTVTGDFNPSLSIMGRTTRHRSAEKQEMYKTAKTNWTQQIHKQGKKCTFFSSAYEIFSSRTHIKPHNKSQQS